MKTLFDTNHNIIRLCLQASALNEKGQGEQARFLLNRAWEDAHEYMERYFVAYFLAQLKANAIEKIRQLEIALQFSQRANNPSTLSGCGTIYREIAQSYENCGDSNRAGFYHERANENQDFIEDGPFYYGTRTSYIAGELLTDSIALISQRESQRIGFYFTALVNGASLDAVLSAGSEQEYIYIVKPLGRFENDPYVTDKKFPGNPTRSYRSKEPLEIIEELKNWEKTTPKQLKEWRNRLAKSVEKIDH